MLRGQALQDALVWTSGKSLGDEDYRFLNASQEVEQRVLQEEKRTLEIARLKAEKKTKKANRWLVCSFLIAFTLTVLSIIITLYASAEEVLAKHYQMEVAIAQGELKKETEDLNDAQKKEKAAEDELKKAQEAIKNVKQQEREAQKLVDKVKLEQQKAVRDLNIEKEGIEHERNAAKLIQQYKLATLDSLVEMMKSGQWLKREVQDARPLEQYPAVNTIAALRTILDSSTRLRNQLESP